MASRPLVVALALAGLATPALAQAPPYPLPRGTPEDAGFSSARLARIGEVLERDIAAGRLPGAVLAIARDGKLVFLEAYGYRDKAAGARMTTDTIFDVASMSKPMTTVTALAQVEQGSLVLDEPVSRYLPGRFTDSRVATLDESGNSIVGTVPATRPISVRDLLTHTSGLVYGGRGATAVHRLYPGGSASAAAELTADQFLGRLSGNPLLNQPGATWDYGFGLDVTGLIVEALTGHDLGEAMADTILRPLGMSDTGFLVPPDKVSRYARALPTDPDTGQPQKVDPDATRPGRSSSAAAAAPCPRPPTTSGSRACCSTGASSTATGCSARPWPST